MKEITHNDNKVQAYNFLMKRENALDILSGKKKIEVRAVVNHYYRQIHDFEQERRNKENPENFALELRRDIKYIHFRNYNSSWFMNVKFKEIGLFSLCKYDIKAIAEEFDFHDFDNAWQEFDHLPREKKPQFYFFVIDEILEHNLT